MKNNLLIDRVFGVEKDSGERSSATLPELLEGIASGTIHTLTGISRHQLEPFHSFLCYLSGAVLVRAGVEDVHQSVNFWAEQLRQLSGNNRDYDSAWKIIVEDPGQPAFMQPPIPEHDGIAAFKVLAHSPDKLGVLQTAKNHDVKMQRMSALNEEAWVYALITLQTTSGFLGKGNYGICRMNGGFASRPFVHVVEDDTLKGRWREDTQRIMALVRNNDSEHYLLRPKRPYSLDGCCLLWTLPWNGSSSLGLDDLHPFFIEVCRRVRLTELSSGVVALGKPTNSPRITVSKDVKGNVGDPWIPIKRRDEAALTLSERGWTVELLRDLIVTHKEREPCALQKPLHSSSAAWFRAAVLVRGQGTTDGFHFARIRIPPQVHQLLLNSEAERERLAELSDIALEWAKNMRWKALRPALFALLEGGPDHYPDQRGREFGAWVDQWLSGYDQYWSDRYFPWLWEAVDRTPEVAKARWYEEILSAARQVLNRAVKESPQRSGRRYRRVVRAESIFSVGVYKNFPEEVVYG